MSCRVARLLAACLTPLALAACSSGRLLEAAAAQPRVEISGAPYFLQRDHQCGPASLATLLGAAGATVSPDSLAHEVYIPGLEGSIQAEMLAAARRLGRIALAVQPTLAALVQELEQGHPVLVLLNFGFRSIPLWHYAVVVGYERSSDRMLLAGGHATQPVAARRFLGTWGRADHWGFIALRPGELPADSRPAPFLDAVAAFAALGQEQAGLLSYQAAVGRWPSDPLAWFALANSRQALGQQAAAETAYREVLRLQPGSLPAQNNLALLLARRGCVAAARALLEPARAAAAGGPFAAQVDDSWREIGALGAPMSGTANPRGSCQ